MWVQVPSPAVSSQKIWEHSSIAQSVEHAAVNRAVVGSSPTRGVLQKWRNWQTRTVQVRVVAIPCGFDSHLLHQRKRRAKVLRFFDFPAKKQMKPGNWETLIDIISYVFTET